MKKILSLLLCAALLLGLAACGAKSEATYSAGAVVEEAAPEAPAMMADNAASLKGANSGSTALPEGRKWIITIDMNVETEDLDSLMTDLDQKIKALNGYVEDQNIHNGSSYASRRYRSANLTVRIPDEKVDQFTDEISGLANVVNQNLRREDITLKYVSTSSRVTALETEEARLLELLAKADNMTDLLEIEARLTDVRYELENHASQLRLYDNMIDYTTISLSVRQVTELSTPEDEMTIWERISTGFMSTLTDLGDTLVDLFVWLIVSSPVLVLLGAVSFCVLKLIQFIRKRKEKKQADKPAQ